MSDTVELQILNGRFAVCRLDAGDPLPPWCRLDAEFVCMTRTDGEFSIVTDEDRVPNDVTAERGYHALRVVGPLDFSLVGLLARLSAALADAGVPVLAISTYDTDVLLVRADRVEDSVAALQSAGFGVR